MGSNPARDASQQPRKIRKMSSAFPFSEISGPFSSKNLRVPLAEIQESGQNANGPKMPFLGLLLNLAACQQFSVVSLCISVLKNLFSDRIFREFRISQILPRIISAKKYEGALERKTQDLWKSKIARLG